SIISPASNSYKYDKELFKILDSSWDTTDPVFSVDTRKGADTSIRKLYVRTSSLFEDLATFNKDISVQEDATVYGRASVGTMTGAGSSTTYPGSKDEYDFNLKGTTNIGKIPGFCTLSKSDVETNFRLCPTGTYLAGMNPNAKDSGTDWFSTCRVFDSQHSLTGDNCYDHPLLFLDWLLKDQSGGPYGFHGYEDSDCKKKFYRWIDIKGGYFKDTFTRRGTTFPKQLGTYSSSQSLIVWYFGEGAPNDFQEDTSCRNSTFCVHQASSSFKWKGYMQRVKVVVTDSNSRQAAVETAEWMSRNRDCD
ncbi:hypothetical protein IT400_04290, partial [Candidatus Nomurabacteria bacterium]|nr:hypothetical protein [Candidatus Nomurabacteria bacterium]